jgi:hypothetical protein
LELFFEAIYYKYGDIRPLSTHVFLKAGHDWEYNSKGISQFFEAASG